FKVADGRMSLWWYSGQMTIRPGEVNRIKLPRAGKPIIGRIKLPDEIGLACADFDYEVNIWLRPPSISGAEDYVQRSFNAYGEFMALDLGKVFQRTKIAVNDRGEFRVEGMPETTYVIQVIAVQKANS